MSAEVFGKYHIKQAFKAQVIKKDEAVKEKIKARLLTAFMFMSLDESDLNIVVDAMDQRKCDAGERSKLADAIKKIKAVKGEIIIN